jgi:hypothetical protein
MSYGEKYIFAWLFIIGCVYYALKDIYEPRILLKQLQRKTRR